MNVYRPASQTIGIRKAIAGRNAGDASSKTVNDAFEFDLRTLRSTSPTSSSTALKSAPARLAMWIAPTIDWYSATMDREDMKERLPLALVER